MVFLYPFRTKWQITSSRNSHSNTDRQTHTYTHLKNPLCRLTSFQMNKANKKMNYMILINTHFPLGKKSYCRKNSYLRKEKRNAHETVISNKGKLSLQLKSNLID